MWPTLFEIPGLDMPIRSYGLMLMIGFLGGTWWAARRAWKVKADPDLVINLGFAALIFSVIGARLFFVIHYWDERFAGRGLWSVIDITAGGMEFYGGLLGAFAAVIVYLLIKRVSLRLYFDILAPSLMFGMGCARIGCFLNGCCWGGVCPADAQYAVTFPYASPAAYRQWEERQITYPAELIFVQYRTGHPFLIPRESFEENIAQRQAAYQAWRQAERELQKARRQGAQPLVLTPLVKARDQAKERLKVASKDVPLLMYQESKYDISPAALHDLAHERTSRTATVYPAQLFASMNGFLLAILLNTLFYRRRRHGLVFGVLFIFYPIMRFIEEIIRSDNPQDTFGFTVSQFISLLLFTVGVVWLIYIYRGPRRDPAPTAVPIDNPRRKELAKLEPV